MNNVDIKINIEVHEEMKEEEIRKLLNGFKRLQEKQIEIPNPAERNEYEGRTVQTEDKERKRL